ncbi:MAG: CHASE3 domain-containing protein [Thiobacillus sp.]|nr:CHASE3 domain-containing protein [Thiobacillus sp.]
MLQTAIAFEAGTRRIAANRFGHGHPVSTTLIKDSALKRTSIPLSWIGVAGLLVASVAFALWTAQAITTETSWRTHTMQVLNTKERLLTALLGAETHERGYLLTGDVRFLASYRADVRVFEETLGELHRLSADQPMQQARLRQLTPLIDARLTRLNNGIALRTEGTPEAVVAFISSGHGRTLMNEIQGVLTGFEHFEKQLLAERSARLASTIRSLTLGVALTALLAVLVVLGALYRTHTLRQATQQHAAFRGALLDNIDAAIISTTPAGIVTSFNRGAEQMLGYAAMEIVNLRDLTLFPDAAQLARRAAEHARPSGDAVAPGFDVFRHLADTRDAGEWQFRRKNGDPVPVALTVSPMLDDAGNLTGYLAIARDVAARKAAEEQIARSLKDLADFKSALDEHAIVATTDASGTITYANDKFCAISKYTQADLIGHTHRVVNSGHHPAAFFEDLWRTISSGKVWSGEILNRAKDGSLYWVHSTIVPFLDDQGIPIQYISIRADITARKQAEQALLTAKTSAELANHTKDSFLATMSHEIRTPLGGLLGMLELLDFTQLSDDQRDTLRAAHESGRSLLRIVNDILDWSKIEAGKLALSPQATSIPQLVASVVNTYARVASSKSLILEQHVDECIESAHVVDPLRLSQILNNFVSNALKFTRKGRVEVTARRLARKDGDETIRFSVKDTGIGMDQDIQQRLFQNFSQGSAETARMYGGTGLGLAICRRLADMMEGEIDVASVPGQGSVFHLTLTLEVSQVDAAKIQQPGTIGDPMPAHTLAHGIPPIDAPTILVVDDHPTNRKLLSIQLGLLGLRAEAAENGDTALVMWRKGRYAAVITDCHMPRMDGYELARLIRRTEAEQGRAATPIIAWTANALADESARCTAAGMDDLLVKPAGMPHLQEVLSKWINSPALLKIDGGIDRPAGAAIVPISFSELDKLVSSEPDRAEVLREFMAQSWADLAALDAAMKVPDTALAARIAHRLKGASRMVGARELTAACVFTVTMARQGQLRDIQAMRDALGRLATYLADNGYPNLKGPS